MKFYSLPRVRLADLPTPLQELKNFSKKLGGPRIFMKRDDLTGLAFGGNKTRKLEYIMADALEQKADYIVTGAGFHSNWCTQAAAAARKLGMKVVLIKSGPEMEYDPEEYDGNHLLHFLMGAEIKVVRPEEAGRVTEETMEELESRGHIPYLLKATGSTPPGVAGYMNCVLEIMSQTVEMGISTDYIMHTTGSGGTQAGLILGTKAFNTGIKVIASTSGSRSKEEQVNQVYNLLQESLDFMAFYINISEDDIIVHVEYSGGGYGFISEEKSYAIRLLAETEGMLIDPVYTGSALACLIDLNQKGFFNKDDVVTLIHTGGTPALFPYKAPLKAYYLGKPFPWKIPPWSPYASS
jgi:D-cysteine desulfhydrase family pyridoxal phosphate-dependent enzyme